MTETLNENFDYNVYIRMVQSHIKNNQYTEAKAVIDFIVNKWPERRFATGKLDKDFVPKKIESIEH